MTISYSGLLFWPPCTRSHALRVKLNLRHKRTNGQRQTNRHQESYLVQF